MSQSSVARARIILTQLGFTDSESIVALRIGIRVVMQNKGLHYDCLRPDEKPIADRLIQTGVLELKGKDLFLIPSKFQLN